MNRKDFNLHPTKLIISEEALKHNVTAYREQLSAKTKLMLMIKAYGYGSGDIAIAKILEKQGILILRDVSSDRSSRESCPASTAHPRLPALFQGPGGQRPMTSAQRSLA